jgi:hydroxyacylglutathione hydrolase
VFFHQRFVGGLAIASYLVGDEKAKECAVIDPTRDVDELVRIATAEGLRITHILETHVHADFASGARELKSRLGGEPKIHCSGMGGADWTPSYADHVVKNGDEVKLGGVRLRALHTPGHTPEHIAWLLFDDGRSRETPWLIFSGDFVFVGDVGRPDLLGETERVKLAHELYTSVFDTLRPLPDFVEIFPAHGAGSLCGKAIGSRRSSSLGFERQFNGSLKPMPEAQWTQKLLAGMPPAPPYFKRMKKLNKAGPPILGPTLPGGNPIALATLRERSDRHEERIVLDVRPKEAFAAAHIPGALSIAMSPQLPTWAGWVLPDDKPMVLVGQTQSDIDEARLHLIRVGFDRIEGFLQGGMDAWQNAGFPIEQLETISVHELGRRLGSASPPFVLDVRTDGEWNAGHIDGATHIQAGMVANHLNELPRDRDIAVICGSGYRSTIAASVLMKHGIKNVISVLGGMTAWQATLVPSPRARGEGEKLTTG